MRHLRSRSTTKTSKLSRPIRRSPTPERPLRVLVAEDDLDLLESLSESFRDEGYEVTAVKDGVELLRLTTSEQLEAHHYDVIVSDLSMPGVSGMGMLMQVNEDPSAPPVVLITGLCDPDVHAWAQQLGAVATFDKPFDVDDLKTVMLNLREARAASMKS
jgi:CheY-like chemotaxis protein